MTEELNKALVVLVALPCHLRGGLQKGGKYKTESPGALSTLHCLSLHFKRAFSINRSVLWVDI